MVINKKLTDIIGTIISNNSSSENLRKYFAIFILFVAIHEVY